MSKKREFRIKEERRYNISQERNSKLQLKQGMFTKATAKNELAGKPSSIVFCSANSNPLCF